MSSDHSDVLVIGSGPGGATTAARVAATGHRVVLITSEQVFWPHKVAPDDHALLIESLERAGIEVVEKAAVERVEASANGGPRRRVVLSDDRAIDGDVVMPFFGLMPSLEFMVWAIPDGADH